MNALYRRRIIVIATATIILLIWSPWRERDKDDSELYTSLCNRYELEVHVGMHQNEVTGLYGQPISKSRPSFVDTYKKEDAVLRPNPPYPDGISIITWKIHDKYDFCLDVSDRGYVVYKHNTLYRIHSSQKTIWEKLRSLFW